MKGCRLILLFLICCSGVAVMQLRGQSLNPTATNYVLQLDGTNCCFRLPSHIFDGQKAITVEAWAKWESFGLWSRVFDFGNQSNTILVANYGTTPNLEFEVWPNTNGCIRIRGTNALRTNEWFYVAAVADQAGLRLCLNGVEVGTATWTGPRWGLGGDNVIQTSQPNARPVPVPNGDHNYVGRSQWHAEGDADFHGQIDAVRVWNTGRTTAQIRADMFRHFRGNEPGLVALYNFDDPNDPGRDATTNGFNGKLVGSARTEPGALPTRSQEASFIYGTVRDDAGKPVTNATIHAEVNDTEIASATSGNDGRYQLILNGQVSAVNLKTIGPGNLAGRRQVELNPTQHWTNVNLNLTPSFPVGGKLTALDGKTPMANVVVELVQAAGADTTVGRDVLIAPRRAGDSPPYPASVATNRVLQLEGTNSYVELPTNMLLGAQALTFEAWLKWDGGQDGTFPVEFAMGNSSHGLALFSYPPRRALILDFTRGYGTSRHGPAYLDALVPGQWCQVAAVASTNGLRIYLNGILVAANDYTERLFSNDAVQQAFLGRNIAAAVDLFQGEMDEVRFWRTARTPQQIRADMTAHFTGHEPGLVGLWNFDDPADPGKDSSTNGHNGKLIGQAKTVAERLPVIVTGRITDASGQALTNAYVEVHRADGETNRWRANTDGDYAFTIRPSEKCDLFATDGHLSAYRLGFQANGQRMQRLDWVLSGTGVAASGRRREEAPSEGQRSEVRSPARA